MSLLSSYRLRIRRQRKLVRAYRKARSLQPLANRTEKIRRNDLLLMSTIRNERLRLPYFVDYYRQLGINHFLFVDNGSEDGSADWVRRQPDCSIWHTGESYRQASFGIDWINYLCRRYGDGHWCLTVDADEFLVYPFCNDRPLAALTDWLDASRIRTFSAMLLDMYPKGALEDQPYHAGDDPMQIARWFDYGNYTHKLNPLYGNLWIQGGPRARVFFADRPEKAPALNKIPLVKWHRKYAYVSSTHMLLPRGLNLVYDQWRGEKPSGLLLHPKFLDTFPMRAQQETQRSEHYGRSAEYAAYCKSLAETPDLWCEEAREYQDWKQLEALGLMSKGNWA